MWSLIIFLLIVLGFIALIKGATSSGRNSSRKSRQSNGNSFSNSDSSWYVGNTGGNDSSNSYDSSTNN
ncbi:MAG: hypothetical protein RM368_20135, partial [Nostoc sp. DedSLP03]|uniref:hypothetical protein n=1 Tax=Nostoc sp. DedSLP03 TaxID=3075400 RepID=UPI002AD30B89